MKTKREIAEKYMALLSTGKVEEIISLFTFDAIVSSPIYGEKKASLFYKELIDDTTSSALKLKGIFEDRNLNSIALYFEYTWTLISGKIVVFDVVDVIVFDDEHKIVSLKIIYDTVVSRDLVNQIKK
ncbi:MAG: nuclear transport factor 2 family protein [Flavobacterium sp.]|nr:MAG: nuclear transport factor 2 family protein [Flavobacterium sp.]